MDVFYTRSRPPQVPTFALTRSCSWAAFTFSFLPCQALRTEACKARPKEKVNAQGLGPGELLMAFRLRVESSSDCPPDKNVIPKSKQYINRWIFFSHQEQLHAHSFYTKCMHYSYRVSCLNRFLKMHDSKNLVCNIKRKKHFYNVNLFYQNPLVCTFHTWYSCRYTAAESYHRGFAVLFCCVFLRTRLASSHHVGLQESAFQENMVVSQSFVSKSQDLKHKDVEKNVHMKISDY